MPVTAWINALPMPALFIGTDARVLACNDFGISILGERLTGRNYINALRQPSVLSAIEECVETRQTTRARYLASEGQSDRTFDLRCAYVLEGQSGILVTLNETTQIVTTTQLHSDFVANVSHELRTPLTAVMGFIETMQGPAKSDPIAQERFLGIMASETARMNRLIDDLLSLSRLEAQARRRPTDVVDLDALLRSIATTFAQSAEDHASAFALDLAAAQPKVLGDSDQLRQVFSNLIENALKYGGQGVEISLKTEGPVYDTRLRTEVMRVIVSDTGRGFDPVHIPRLTERFYRIDSHRSRDQGGTGLGLAIVKHIISRHRGRLSISSVPSQGSDFTVIYHWRSDG